MLAVPDLGWMAKYSFFYGILTSKQILHSDFTADIHKLELVDKFKTLKEKGLLHKHLAKKKKKNASKQRKKMLMTGSLMKET